MQIQHVEVLAEFMEDNPEFARGRLSASNAREKFKALWGNLTTRLNSLGLEVRDVEKWQKTWSDYKSNLKKKAAKIRRYQEGTGGGPATRKTLSDIEQRILNILGTMFYAGIGVDERGINVSILGSSTSTAYTTTSQQSITKIENNNYDAQQHPSTSAAKRGKESEGPREQACPRQDQDHDYLFFGKHSEPPPKKKKKSKEPMEAYEETIECLKSIENTLKCGLSEINLTLKEGFQSLSKRNNDLP